MKQKQMSKQYHAPCANNSGENLGHMTGLDGMGGLIPDLSSFPLPILVLRDFLCIKTKAPCAMLKNID